MGFNQPIKKNMEKTIKPKDIELLKIVVSFCAKYNCQIIFTDIDYNVISNKCKVLINNRIYTQKQMAEKMFVYYSINYELDYNYPSLVNEIKEMAIAYLVSMSLQPAAIVKEKQFNIKKDILHSIN
jgi:malate synthase